jgi:regulator of protease activity HflC (stomatin/prohibitin superfamily)
MSMFSILAIVLCILFLSASIKVLREYERGVVFRLGRFFMVKGPGLVIIIPIIDKLIRVHLDKEIPGWQGLPKEALDEKVKALVLHNP